MPPQLAYDTKRRRCLSGDRRGEKGYHRHAARPTGLRDERRPHAVLTAEAERGLFMQHEPAGGRMYYVYVIELADEAGPRVDPRRPCVYVGQSALLPDNRFRQHKEGIHAARVVRHHGRWLRRKLYEQYNPIATREDAEKMERWLAQHLRERGFTVFGGH